MNRKRLKQEYFEWLLSYAKCYRHRELLLLLFQVDFTYTVPMDGNRFEDGINLRYRFADEKGYKYKYISPMIDDVPCSMLEMMVALALRIEEHITGDPDVGDRTSRWFKDMLKNCGLYDMTDERFSRRSAIGIVNNVLNRNYERNGDGGLFCLRRTRTDLRNVEIWYQAMWYIDEVLDIK